jgi:hypothetical protein
MKVKRYGYRLSTSLEEEKSLIDLFRLSKTELRLRVLALYQDCQRLKKNYDQLHATFVINQYQDFKQRLLLDSTTDQSTTTTNTNTGLTCSTKASQLSFQFGQQCEHCNKWISKQEYFTQLPNLDHSQQCPHCKRPIQYLMTILDSTNPTNVNVIKVQYLSKLQLQQTLKHSHGHNLNKKRKIHTILEEKQQGEEEEEEQVVQPIYYNLLYHYGSIQQALEKVFV